MLSIRLRRGVIYVTMVARDCLHWCQRSARHLIPIGSEMVRSKLSWTEDSPAAARYMHISSTLAIV